MGDLSKRSIPNVSIWGGLYLKRDLQNPTDTRSVSDALPWLLFEKAEGSKQADCPFQQIYDPHHTTYFYHTQVFSLGRLLLSIVTLVKLSLGVPRYKVSCSKYDYREIVSKLLLGAVS